MSFFATLVTKLQYVFCCATNKIGKKKLLFPNGPAMTSSPVLREREREKRMELGGFAPLPVKESDDDDSGGKRRVTNTFTLVFMLFRITAVVVRVCA